MHLAMLSVILVFKVFSIQPDSEMWANFFVCWQPGEHKFSKAEGKNDNWLCGTY